MPSMENFNNAADSLLITKGTDDVMKRIEAYNLPPEMQVELRIAIDGLIKEFGTDDEIYQEIVETAKSLSEELKTGKISLDDFRSNPLPIFMAAAGAASALGRGARKVGEGVGKVASVVGPEAAKVAKLGYSKSKELAKKGAAKMTKKNPDDSWGMMDPAFRKNPVENNPGGIEMEQPNMEQKSEVSVPEPKVAKPEVQQPAPQEMPTIPLDRKMFEKMVSIENPKEAQKSIDKLKKELEIVYNPPEQNAEKKRLIVNAVSKSVSWAGSMLKRKKRPCTAQTVKDKNEVISMYNNFLSSIGGTPVANPAPAPAPVPEVQQVAPAEAPVQVAQPMAIVNPPTVVIQVNPPAVVQPAITPVPVALVAAPAIETVPAPTVPAPITPVPAAEIPKENPAPKGCEHLLKYVGKANPKGASGEMKVFRCVHCTKHFTRG